MHDVVEPVAENLHVQAQNLKCPQEEGKFNAKPFKHHHPCHSIETMDKHLEMVAAKLTKLDPKPHLINLVELDGCQVMRDVLEKTNKYLPGWATPFQPYLIYGNDDRTNEQTGFILTLPPTDPLVRTAETVKTLVSSNPNCAVSLESPQGAPKHYLARFSVPLPSGSSFTLIVVGVHLKSKRSMGVGEGDSCSVREAEALIIRNKIEELLEKDPDAEVVVLGDFNDHDPEVLDRRGAFSQEKSGFEPEACDKEKHSACPAGKNCCATEECLRNESGGWDVEKVLDKYVSCFFCRFLAVSVCSPVTVLILAQWAFKERCETARRR
uniref:Endonuclease/exonuclease/phosphatase domain-containing protein n=1 Tax=Chromera velia CCMP2878 TaxID=1169474 RepID=A0A0G4GX96_9ALVE|eukprot:Cvel_23707.t1-p1 / transcript=Cvel_23707.t1 / gene=Cvel_23707 / organism=Chromera_velia_CCMP2878 / gene_product=hypothetical protein / transcript_product=hypothetical protein / location=Cvel_scaffold2475:5685-7438(-) / protein_length=323 / sequence_SO=supercontig / SO=protein_coding / is_pseudo=false